MSGVGMSRFPIASKQLIIAHLSELMVKIWPEIAAVLRWTRKIGQVAK